MMTKRRTSDGYMKKGDTRVMPGYDDDKNSVRAEPQERKVKIVPIPHMQDPKNVIDNLNKKRNPKPQLI